MSLEPLPVVSGADDEAFLVDQFEELLKKAVADNKPFLAVLFFHGVHIPCTHPHTPSYLVLMMAARSRRPRSYNMIAESDVATPESRKQ